jgi:hypothetical protein
MSIFATELAQILLIKLRFSKALFAEITVTPRSSDEKRRSKRYPRNSQTKSGRTRSQNLQRDHLTDS